MKIKTLALSLALSACSEIGLPPPEPLPTPSPTPTATATPIPAPTNPPCPRAIPFEDGPEGNVWKPVADHSPNCVILLHSKWVEEFSCKALLKTGEYSGLKFTGYANGDRHHHRCDRKAGRYARDGHVLCEDSSQVCKFTYKGKPKRRHD